MPSTDRQLVKPPALRPGDTIGVVAPASNLNRTDLEAGCDALRDAGYKPFCFDSILDRDLYFAGSTSRRTRELEDMFSRKEVRAILCARGGYGSNYLLNGLNLEIVKAYPKIFIGYSDLTSLLDYFVDAAGLAVFHGPMAAKDWAHSGGVDLTSWQAALSGLAAWDVPLNDGVIGLAEGEAEGVLYGGCLSILVASLGCFRHNQVRWEPFFTKTNSRQCSKLLRLSLSIECSLLRARDMRELPRTRSCLPLAWRASHAQA